MSTHIRRQEEPNERLCELDGATDMLEIGHVKAQPYDGDLCNHCSMVLKKANAAITTVLEEN